MKKIIALVLCAVFAFSICFPVYAAQGSKCYYVDAVYGDDENDGTSPEQAWKTMERAGRSIFSAGDSLLLRRGQTFGGNFITHGNGSESAPIVLSAYGDGESPVIHAQSGEFLFLMQNVSHWVMENIEFTSDGFGAIILAQGGENTEDITIRNCYFHDISPDKTETIYSALYFNTERGKSKIRNIHLDSLRIENTSWGIHTNGTNAENDKDYFVNPQESYNSDFLIENIFINNAKCAGIVLGAVCNGTVRNCRVLNCATAQDSAYAPLWLRHSYAVTVEYCEIAGSTNKTDGMAIDFDGWTTNCTYRYIYSHDNTRFMKNCVFDCQTKNSGNTVRNCVSVNDNRKMNWGAVCLVSLSRPSIGRMADFSFFDNMIINGTPVFWLCTKKPLVKNVVFTGSSFGKIIQMFFNMFIFPKNFTYTVPENKELNARIEEITANLPKS